MSNSRPSPGELTKQRLSRAQALARDHALAGQVDLTLSEALVLGLLRQGVSRFFSVFGHGSTEIGEVLRIYQQAGALKVIDARSEIEASHAAAALRWITGEKAAVVTSIGPGALQALAASLVPASDGLGVYYLFGDETTEDEGYNMQQVPKHGQGAFHQLCSAMGRAYTLHTPAALPAALQQGAAVVDHPYRPGPFYLLLPMNTQASWLPGFNLDELPEAPLLRMGAAEGDYTTASRWIEESQKIVIKAGGGARLASKPLLRLLEKSGAVLVHTPIASGCIPFSHPQNMGVGGSKGSLCGNAAMEQADLLIAIGTRGVCQSDCSRTGYPNARRVININADPEDATHYRHSLPLVGDIVLTLEKLNTLLTGQPDGKDSWLALCAKNKRTWQNEKDKRLEQPVLFDEYHSARVLTQPAVVYAATRWARDKGIPAIFDAGDVQANGFQLAEDENPRQTFSETGASYMGFAVSALLASAATSQPFYALAFTGDGSFTMNPQVIIDGVEHGARGCILLLDNGRMGAITGLQKDQYGEGFATWNTLKVDYIKWASSIPGLLALDGGGSLDSLLNALEQAAAHPGLSLVHVPVYFGSDPLGGMGVYGRWNVGCWCDDVQALRHRIGL